MAALYRIAIVGSGNVATQLGPAFKKAGHQIVMIISKKKQHAVALANKLGSASSTRLADIPTETDIILIAVNDDAIQKVANGIRSTNALVVHTSGSTDKKTLATFKKHGVFYPLQTFSKKRKVNIKNSPLLVEGSNKQSLELIKTLAKSISTIVIPCTSPKRNAIHIAAVFACNFPNYLLGIASEILKKEKENITLLEPLIQETVARALKGDPHRFQTGPARRNDKITLKIHLDFLKGNKDYQHIYRELSNAIVKKHKL
jgi:predicted short-subunit dehydrogenase-like oxidoreductase (DUF2520 family)